MKIEALAAADSVAQEAAKIIALFARVAVADRGRFYLRRQWRPHAVADAAKTSRRRRARGRACIWLR